MPKEEFEMRPASDVPPQVAARVEAKVFAALDTEPQRRSRRWMGAAAAAAAAVVGLGVVGAAVLANDPLGSSQAADRGSVSGDPGPARAVSPPQLDPAKAQAELDRCRRAVGDDSRFPARDQWHPLFQVDGPAATVTAARVDGQPVFCETSKATVTVSVPGAAPAYVAGSRTGSLLMTPNGTIAGVLDPTWRAPQVKVTGPEKDSISGPVQSQDDLFVFLSVIPTRQDTTVTVVNGANPERALPRPTSDPVTVSTTGMPEADRSSPRSRLLGQCIDDAQSGVVDAPSWGPGAMVEAGEERLIMARNQFGVSACFQQEHRTTFLPYTGRLPSPGESGQPKLLSVAPAVDDRPLLAGTVPAPAARIELTLADDTVVTGDVANSTFAVLLPASSATPVATSGPTVKDMDKISCHLLGVDGQTLYDGPLMG
ncbi:hypothetical protein [Amycolatopsis aidingensis]|uniref:hypothetical protein n=1 Tax=Amycolatopsis aidingensis TaxID=2842453 RepID=UPI001C0C9CAD|nr:hypothetical protein [Amycolatopsis aidingensis]